MMDDVAIAASLFFGFFGAMKVIEEVIGRRFMSRKAQFEFSKDYVAALERDELSVLSKEKGFYALSGRICSFPEIKYLLALPNPSQTIEDTSYDFPVH